ncbi:nucleotidyltransferase family protein [Streptomyces sp. NPDC001507]|uniref:nucleotidyltransferase family protein n=1 Tax=Streptomyces sp. NPDC001507 TaxID=3364579 RepID=UPI00368E8D6F
MAPRHHRASTNSKVNTDERRHQPHGQQHLGVRLESDGGWRVYAPHGLSDVFNLVVRPNPVLAPREGYETKAARWKNEWPELTVLPWPN